MASERRHDILCAGSTLAFRADLVVPFFDLLFAGTQESDCLLQKHACMSQSWKTLAKDMLVLQTPMIHWRPLRKSRNERLTSIHTILSLRNF